MRQIKVSELVIDMEIYPRLQVDEAQVQALALAYQNGAKLPPLVICKDTLKITDGVHRTRMYLQEEGPNFLVTVAERKYRDNCDRVLDAIKRNAKHGVPLRDGDRRHCVTLVTRAGGSTDLVAKALGVNPSAIGPLRTVQQKNARLTTRAMSGRQPVQGKGPITPHKVRTVEQQMIDALLDWYRQENNGSGPLAIDRAKQAAFDAAAAYIRITKQAS